MLKKEFPIEDEWLAYELRPETPREGIPLATVFPGIDLKQRYENMNKAGDPYGISFGELSRVSNSHAALQAAEYAKDLGKFHEFHDRVFMAYFLELLDIGNPDVMLMLAREVGLDHEGLREALETDRYAPRLTEAREDATKSSITAVPTFIIADEQKIVGAQSLDVFRKRLQAAATK
ncbi:MAG: DsbA family protein [Desulfomonile tiedjei]|uniref:DsbA family protein n=1 Tax=Desulfomonile tiedjei TaxID=2358 RepID=A0A9D6V184_9BACT|nr:DsbA family protein [Desulfomonile tiedjei]